MSAQDKIISRIRKLRAIADDQPNTPEGRSARKLADKMLSMNPKITEADIQAATKASASEPATSPEFEKKISDLLGQFFTSDDAGDKALDAALEVVIKMMSQEASVTDLKVAEKLGSLTTTELIAARVARGFSFLGGVGINVDLNGKNVKPSKQALEIAIAIKGLHKLREDRA